MNRFLPWLQLLRPANIVTAFADILAGTAVAGSIFLVSEQARSGFWPLHVPALPEGFLWLLAATFGLYGGGVVLNDLFDASLDATERPERPIPSGRISRRSAALFGFSLLLAGTFIAFQVNLTSGFIALAISLSVLIYDSFAKKYVFWGPLFMGLCRSGNLLLGISVFPMMVLEHWYLGLLPLIYIFSITLISRGEVHGGNRKHAFGAILALLAVVSGLLLPGVLPTYSTTLALPFSLLLLGLVLPAFVKVATNPDAAIVRNAVKRGVLSLVIINSALAAGFGGLGYGLLVLLLLPLSLLLARAFAVT